MSAEKEAKLTLKPPKIRAETETQTSGQLVVKTPDAVKQETDMEKETQSMSLRKRRNLSKNRGQAARQREQTPEPSRTSIPHEDTPSSEDEHSPRNSREIEADNTYEEMKKLVHAKANDKDPVYDLDTNQVMEARASAANERRRRSISPFALQDKEDFLSGLQRKGSFIDPTNKLLSTNYTLSPKEEDKNKRRGSLIIEPPSESNNSLLTPTSSTASPRDKEFPYPMPSTPKKQEPITYPDEGKPAAVSPKKPKTPNKNDTEFTFDEKETKRATKASLKPSENPSVPGELVTKVIQVERSPSRRLSQDKKPEVQVRERIVRTPSRKMSTDVKPSVVKQIKPPTKEEPPAKVPPVKPARSKSATRFGVSFYIKLLFILIVALLIAICFLLS